MQTHQIRNLNESDLVEVWKMWDEEFPEAYANPLPDPGTLQNKTFGRETFDREGSFVATVDSQLVGAVLSFGDRKYENDNYWHMIVAGWIGLLIVRPDSRGQGIGKSLLNKAEQYHRDRGRVLLFTGGGEKVENLFRGLDREWSDANAFFEKQGYVFARSICFVNTDLSRFELPPEIAGRRQKLAGEGVNVEPASPEDALLYLNYLKKNGNGPSGRNRRPHGQPPRPIHRRQDCGKDGWRGLRHPPG